MTTTEDTEVLGVAPAPPARDPDLPLVIIDLSGHDRPATDPRPLPAIPFSLGPAAMGQIPAPPPDQTSTSSSSVESEPATIAIDIEPATVAIDIESATVAIDIEPATVGIDIEPATIPMTAAEPATAPIALPARRFRGRARVMPRAVRRKPRPADVRDHRRRVPRSRLRAWEAAAWIAALGVVATMVGFVVRSVPVSAPFHAGQNPSAAAVGLSPQCHIEGCRTTVPAGPPTRVRIPSISVDSTLESLRLDARKELTAPVAYDQAGWYAGGVVPGDPGPAVIAGHVDSVRGPAVFFKLHTLKAGDTVDVERGGTWITFRVTLVEKYPKDQFPTDKVYRPTPDPELRVITCGGDFDTVHKRYYDNVVVYAVLV